MTITRDVLNLTLQEPLKMPLVPPLQEALGLFPLLVTFGGQDQKHVQTILLRTISQWWLLKLYAGYKQVLQNALLF